MKKQEPVAIVLPVYNSGRHLAPAIRSIIRNTEYPYKLIIVESESTDGSAEVCDWYAAKHDNIKVYHTKKAGITKAINFGITKADNLDVYLTQDDVILPKLYGRDWLTELVKHKNEEKCGIVTTINAGGKSGQLYLKDFVWTGTWSMFIPRKTLNKIGLFDENFSPGPGDDICFSYRVYKAGLRTYVANFWVDHHRQTENFNDNIEFKKMENAGYFRIKYGLFPQWKPYYIFDEKFLFDERSFKVYGCFNLKKELDDPETFLEIRNITKDFTADDVVIDVGAHIGVMSMAVQKGKVFAFEPTPETFEVLQNNCIINEWKNIIPLNHAVSEIMSPYQIGYARINKEQIYWAGMNKINIVKEVNKNSKFTMPLDDMISQFHNVKLIKIDTEGHDLKVLKGAKKILKKYHPLLITEHIKKDNKFLKSFGYKVEKQIGINFLWRKK